MLESRSRPRPAVLGDLWEDHAGRIAGEMLTRAVYVVDGREYDFGGNLGESPVPGDAVIASRFPENG